VCCCVPALHCRRGDLPGLDELYLTTMDSIENITRADALYLLQGSVLSTSGARYGLSSGEPQAACFCDHELACTEAMAVHKQGCGVL
jgi:hypothetical protein